MSTGNHYVDKATHELGELLAETPVPDAVAREQLISRMQRVIDRLSRLQKFDAVRLFEVFEGGDAWEAMCCFKQQIERAPVGMKRERKNLAESYEQAHQDIFRRFPTKEKLFKRIEVALYDDYQNVIDLRFERMWKNLQPHFLEWRRQYLLSVAEGAIGDSEDERICAEEVHLELLVRDI